MDVYSVVRLPQSNSNAGCIPHNSKAQPKSNGIISEYQSAYRKWMVYKQADSMKPQTTTCSLLQLGIGCPTTYTTNYKAEYEGWPKMEKREPNYRRDEESYKQPDTFSYGQSTYSAQYPYRPDVYKTSRARQIVQPTSLFGNNERKLAELYKETEVLMQKRKPFNRSGQESYKQPDIFPFQSSSYSAHYQYRPDVYKTSRARQMVQPTSLYGNNERKLAELYRDGSCEAEEENRSGIED